MKRTQRLFLLTIFAALALEAQGKGDSWANIAWYFHADLSSWAGVRIVMSLLEILLLLSALLWLTAARRQHPRLRLTRGVFATPLLVFTLLLAFGVLFGFAQSGANLTIALWEIRGFAMMVGAYLLAGMFLRTASDLERFLWTVLLASSALAVANILRWALVLRTSGRSYDLAYDHGDALILAVAAILCVSLLFFGGTRAQRRFAVVALPLFIVAMAIMERRSAFVVLGVGLGICALFVLRLRPRAFWKVCAPVAVLIGLYLVVFWNNTGFLGQPARAISSMFNPDTRDAASNLYRDLEKIDILFNIQRAPMTGLGFGQQYTFFVPLPDLSFWPFWHYMPHNSILWLWMKDGALGFFAFWWLFGRAAYDGSRALVTQREQWAILSATQRRIGWRQRPPHGAQRAGITSQGPTSATSSAPISGPSGARPLSRGTARRTRGRRQDARQSGTVALLVTCVAMIPMLVTFAYVDLGLTNERVLLFVGLLLGILARAHVVLGIPPAKKRRSLGRAGPARPTSEAPVSDPSDVPTLEAIPAYSGMAFARHSSSVFRSPRSPRQGRERG
ncbi:MAG: O-antigen ligase family protein [Ktedonobacterales bacterium]|nr:O-antigen ligase family protein [Ktedonobacterales bacterium]